MSDRWLHSQKLTLNVRYRTGWFGKQILQVEEVATVHSWDGGCYPAPTPFDGTIEYTWRDATSIDLQTLIADKETPMKTIDLTNSIQKMHDQLKILAMRPLTDQDRQDLIELTHDIDELIRRL